MLKSLGRWAPLTGAVFAVLFFVGAMVGGKHAGFGRVSTKGGRRTSRRIGAMTRQASS